MKSKFEEANKFRAAMRHILSIPKSEILRREAEIKKLDGTAKKAMRAQNANGSAPIALEETESSADSPKD